MNKIICFIGGGNMTQAMVSGLVLSGINPKNLIVTDRNENKLKNLETNYNIQTTTDIKYAISIADILFLAVKPQSMQHLIAQVGEDIKLKNPLIITVAAGIKLDAYHKWLSYECSIVRTMPNTASAVQSGAVGIFGDKNITIDQKDYINNIMKSMGVYVWVDDEGLIDVVAAVSGSGQAYFLLMMEHMVSAAIKMGLSEDQAKKLVIQTSVGSSKMALANDNLSLLRENITSKGGATAMSIESFNNNNFESIIEQAMKANVKRSGELSVSINDLLT